MEDSNTNNQDSPSVGIGVSFDSPFPPPSWLKKYEEMSPGISRAIIDEYFKMCDHFR